MNGSKGLQSNGRPMQVLLRLVIPLLLLTSCGSSVRANPSHEIPNSDPDRGRQAMVQYGCIACHTTPGVTRANATVGPPLTGWANRASIAGQFPNTPEYLIPWLQHPQQLIPGSIMPDAGVPESVAHDMSAYLYTLQ
jgi:cytochrome c